MTAEGITEQESKHARIEVICGPMFSGKTKKLIRRIRNAEKAGQKVQVFKPSLDDRYGPDTVKSHDGNSVEAIAIECSEEIFKHLSEKTSVVAIDEAQFFDDSFIEVCRRLVEEKDLRVIITGLDLDFRGEPFGPMPGLIDTAEQLDRLCATCVKCGKEATRSQRTIDDKPAHYDDPVVMIGAQETYGPCCEDCHEVPGKPTDPGEIKTRREIDQSDLSSRKKRLLKKLFAIAYIDLPEKNERSEEMDQVIESLRNLSENPEPH